MSYINNKRFSTKSRAKLPKKVELAVILLVVESANIPSVDSSLLAAASPSTWLWGGGYSQQPLTQIAFHSLCNCFTMANLTTSFCTFSMEKRISLYNCCLELELDNVDKSSFWFLSWAVSGHIREKNGKTCFKRQATSDQISNMSKRLVANVDMDKSRRAQVHAIHKPIHLFS